MGDEHVMANYPPIILDQAAYQWLVSLPENSIDSWEDLREAFIDNFIATCDQSGNKYDLQRIRDRWDEPLRDNVRRFFDMRWTIPKITDDEAISAFIQGLYNNYALWNKLVRNRPTTIQELLAVVKKYDDAAEKSGYSWYGIRISLRKTKSACFDREKYENMLRLFFFLSPSWHVVSDIFRLRSDTTLDIIFFFSIRITYKVYLFDKWNICYSLEELMD